MYYTVGETACRLGVAASTLRYYDKEGLLPFVERSSGGIRMFKESDFEWLSIIECLKKADIPEKYGYKLLSGEKHTRQRDIILRICYAAELTLEQTQRALRKYEMPQLYAKIPRDAFLMLIFKDRPGGIIEVNELLSKNGMEMLRTSGVQE